MSVSFFNAVQSALETYACSLGSEPWFYAAAGFAAAGQGVGALAATVGGVATSLGCGEPPGLPSEPGPDIIPTYDSGLSPQPRQFKIRYKGPYVSAISGICDEPVVFDFDVTHPAVTTTRQLKLAPGVFDGTPRPPCGTVTFGGYMWTYENPIWVRLGFYIWVGWTSEVQIWGWEVNQPEPPSPPKPPDPPPIIVPINYTVNDVDIQNDIKIEAPDFIFSPNGDFNLSFPVTVLNGPNINFPFSFNFDLNYSTGGSPSGGGDYGNKPSGSGPKLPPADRPSECPEIPEDPQISGSWSKADCINGEPLFTPVNWSGKGFAGVADALNKLNQVIGPWQENTYDCDDELPMEPLFGIPVSEYTGHTTFEPSVTLYFYEPNLLAVEAGRSNRVRRRITIPVAVPPADPDAFLDAEAQFWEGYEWQCGVIVGRAKLPGGAGNVMCQAITGDESLRVLTAVFNRYGQPLDYERGFRYSTGAPPTDQGGKGGLRIQTTVRFHCISYADMATTYGPVYPSAVLLKGPSQCAT
jgi:hypothetical protein